MSSHSNLKLAFFQQLLANAFTVQECGMDRQSLAGIVDLQRSIQEGSLGEQGTMQLIAERTRNVATASGVAIGLLNRDHLFYAAGTGTAISYVGMRVKAALTVSRMNEDRAEILRVENADVDQRIEAAVCRQFHAKSLLILPVYRGRVLAGVLHILFDEPHTFEDQELRTYRILANLLSEALFQQVSPEQARAASDKLNATRALIEQKVSVERRPIVASPIPMVANAPEAVAKVQSISPAESEPPEIAIEELPSPDLLAFWRQCLPLCRRARISELAVATVVAVFAWVLCTQKPARGFSAAIVPSKTPVELSQPVTAPQVQVPAYSPQAQVSASAARESVPRELAPTMSRWRIAEKGKIKRFGSDVTVRYFTPNEATIQPRNAVQIRQLSDDVTVRYIKPTNTVEKQPPEGTATNSR